MSCLSRSSKQGHRDSSLLFADVATKPRDDKRSQPVTSPRGEAFDRAGRAGPLKEMKPAPSIPAEAGGARLSIKEGRIFLCSRPDGDIDPKSGGDGLYRDDTRFLSQMRLRLSGKKPVLLTSTAADRYAMVINSTNPRLGSGKNHVVDQQALAISRHRVLDERMYEQIRITNFSARRASISVEIALAADFADTFEIRGVAFRELRGELLVAKTDKDKVTFGYLGEDQVFRETIVRADPTPDLIETTSDSTVLRWELAIDPAGMALLNLTVEASIGGDRRRSKKFAAALETVRERQSEWTSSALHVETDHGVFNEIVHASGLDLRALSTPMGEDRIEIIAAGIPWFVAPFGRDSLLTCYEMMMFDSRPARDALRFLVSRQARTTENWRDAEPGKILHELRQGELAGAGLIPHTPYYGSVDSTPLFLMLAAAYFRWTNDLDFIRELLPAVEAALAWVDVSGDHDGDGFVEYSRESAVGLVNQGWKDSEDSMVHTDGSLAVAPIALAEVQGYVYLAKLRWAEIYRALGSEETSQLLHKQADDLKDAFNEVFWMPKEGTFAMALDADKKQVGGIASNPGHCLYCGLIEPSKAAAVVERLTAPDMFSGWGIRTLSSESPAYNPMSYHNGSVWPHDTAIVAAGFKRYGFHEETNLVATALFDAAAVARDRRLPELYCGFDREVGVPYVNYPVACSPQAWASAVPFMMLQSMLGISARAHENVLTVNHPTLPDWLKRVELTGVKIADSTLSLNFQRDRERTSFALSHREGSVRVSVEE